MAELTATPLDREFVATEAMALGDLMLWVNQARDLIDEIQGIAAYSDTPLSKAIEQLNIRVNTPDWQGINAGEGLTYLMHHQHKLIRSLT